MSVVGFDFGYQSCYIAVARQGGIETVANEYSDRCTPAYVSLGEKNRSMGASAKNQVISNLKNTVWGWKKLLGRTFQDPIVQREKGLFPYEIVEGPNGSTGVRVQYLGESQVFSPEQLTAMMFTKLRETAGLALKTKVIDCVISCPCYFTDAERRALLSAAQMAGLNVLRLMNDTTATALAYGIYKQDLPTPEEKSRNVVFVDMGHSDLQVAVAAFNKGKLKVLATSADANIGGRDLDMILARHFTEDFKTRYKVDANTKPKAFIRLLSECEKLKKLMSANSTDIPINIECFLDDKDVSGKMKREVLEKMAENLFLRVEAVMKACMDNAKLKPEDVYSVEVIGGSSRVPGVKQLVRKVFNLDPSTTLNSDESVARGCALQCAILSPVFRVRDFNIQDAQPYPITLSWTAGMEDESEMEVFSKFHSIPFSKMLTFYRKDPFVIDAKYSCLQDILYPSAEIGKFAIENVVPQANGESSKVKVKVRVNIHGVFNVSSASMVEKQEKEEEAKEEPMETEENATPASEENKEKDAASNSENMDTSNTEAEAPAEESSTAENSEEQKEQKPEENKEAAKDDKEKKEKEKEKETKKKQKVKTIDLPVKAEVRELSSAELNLLFEKEGQMQAADKLEKERADAKNAVEEYVYEMRDKVYGDLEQYVKEADRESLCALLTSTEDWIYDEGEDQNKQVYVDKLAELKKLGQPIVDRYTESLSRPKAFEELGRSVMLVRKALELYSAGDEKYSHIDKADMEKVEKCLKEKADWFERQFQACQALQLYDNPPVQTMNILNHKTFLESTCNPILNKPKPKPKVEEPPPEDNEKKDEKAEGDKSEEKEEAQNTENTENTEQMQDSTEENKADMDLD